MLGFAQAGQVSVEGGDVGIFVAEVDLDLAEIFTPFQQVGRVGMTQGVDMGVLFDAAGFECEAKGALEGAALDGICSGCGALTGMAFAGEEQRGVAMGFPLFAQEQERALRQGHVTITIAFAGADVEEHALGINVTDQEVQAFAQAQAAGIDGDEADPMIQGRHAGQDAAGLGGGEHDREFELVIGADQLNFSGPGATEGFLPEQLDGAQGLGGGLTGDFFVALEVNEVLAEFFGGDQVGGFAVELRELADAGEVGLFGARTDGQELEIVGEGIKDGVRGTFFICMGALLIDC